MPDQLRGLQVFDGIKAYSLTEAGWLTPSGDNNAPEISAYLAYRRVPWVRAAVAKLAATAGSVPIDVMVNDEVIADPAAADIRLGVGWRKLIQDFVVDLAVYGRAFAYLQVNVVGRNPQPVRWSPAGVTVTWLTDGTPIFRRVSPSGAVPTDSVIDWWTGDPAVEVGGAVPLVEPALGAAETLRNLDGFTSRYFRGGAIKATLLRVSGTADQREMDRLSAWWNSLLTGVSKAWRAIAIRSNIEPVVIGGDVKDTSAPELVQKAREDVAAVIGIPQTLLMSNAASYATATVDMAVFLTQTVIPLVERMVDRINEHPVYQAAGVRLVVHGERMEALQEAELAKATQLQALTGGQPVLSVNEARQQLGYEVVEAEAEATSEADDGEDGDSQPPAMSAEELRTLRKRALAAHRLGLPLRVDPRFDGELAACKSASDIREVFDRHWPRG